MCGPCSTSQNASVNDVPQERRGQLDASGVRGPGPDGRRRETGNVATETYQPPETVARIQRLGMGVALAGVVVTAVGFLMCGQERFFQAYLVAYTFVFGIVLGSMALLMVQHLSGGAWGLVIRRPLEAAVRTMPIMALCICPLRSASTTSITGRTPRSSLATRCSNRRRRISTRRSSTSARWCYFAIWIAISQRLLAWSAEQDRSGDPALVRKFSILSGAGLVIYSLTVTFAMVDWTMSVNPHWFSTMWGPLYMVGQGLSAMAFVITIVIMLSQTAPLNRIVTSHHLHDLGKLLFAFLMLHAYLSFSQFLIIWSANLSEEIPHYLIRWDSGYQYVSIFMIFGHFAVPYALLLSRDIKRSFTRLRIIATWLLFARLVDYYWHVAPEFHKEGLERGDPRRGDADCDRRRVPGAVCRELAEVLVVAGERSWAAESVSAITFTERRSGGGVELPRAVRRNERRRSRIRRDTAGLGVRAHRHRACDCREVCGVAGRCHADLGGHRLRNVLVVREAGKRPSNRASVQFPMAAGR